MDSLWSQETVYFRAQRAIHPGGEGDAQAPLAPSDDGTWQPAPSDALQDPFRSQAPHLEVGGQSKRKGCEIPVEIGCPRLERNKHRGAVDLREEVVTEVSGVVPEHGLGEHVGG